MLKILIVDKYTGQFKYIEFKTYTNVQNPKIDYGNNGVFNSVSIVNKNVP